MKIDHMFLIMVAVLVIALGIVTANGGNPPLGLVAIIAGVFLLIRTIYCWNEYGG